MFALTSCVGGSCSGPATEAGRDESGNTGVVVDTELVDHTCNWPTSPAILLEENGAILQVWSFPLDAIHSRHVLPNDPDLLAYRNRIRQMGAAVRHPPLQIPDSVTPDMQEVWRDEEYNNQLAYSGVVGTIAPLTCLDALLFAEQNRRFSQIEHPTEFLASVLVDEARERVRIVFGAGDEVFLPGSVYGFDVIDEYMADGWRYWYALHNHTLQSSTDQSVLGVPVPSTSDVSLARTLAEERGLETLRVTNGFYTFSASVEDLAEFHGRKSP